MEAVHADWKEYLNLLICEESHLKYMEDYHQVPAWPPRPTNARPPCATAGNTSVAHTGPGALRVTFLDPGTYTANGIHSGSQACWALVTFQALGEPAPAGQHERVCF
jgi:hypothetical protein